MKNFAVSILKSVKMELITALKISLIIMAIYAAGWPAMIFQKLYKMIANLIVTFCNLLLAKMRFRLRVDKTICKPLFFCPICMASFWSILFWIIWGFSFNPILMIFYVAGINTVLTAIIAPIIPDNED